jgi:DNA invertase Pin-like site-specific DNA recombinase
MIACYVRVSTIGQNAASQKREITRWLEGNNVDLASVLWFVDKKSGDDLMRPKFEQLQAGIFAGEIKTVVVWRLDRLSRKLRDGLNVLCDWCDRKLRIVAVSQQIDFSGAMGKMLAAVILGIAEMEQETRRERQAAGIAAAKAAGTYLGRKAGTTKGKPQRAQELRTKGLTTPEIAEAMGISQRTVFNYLGR